MISRLMNDIAKTELHKSVCVCDCIDTRVLRYYMWVNFSQFFPFIP